MEKIDIKGGQMTFGQRIELGQVLTDPSTSERDKVKATMKCLNVEWTIADLTDVYDYFEDVLLGIQYWIKCEAQLKYKHSAEELAAGVEALSLQVGDMGTIMAIAKDYGKDPDEVLQWKYSKVFNILFTNLQTHLYRERLDKRLSDKAKAESRKGRMGKR